jgi:hypothetical protein
MEGVIGRAATMAEGGTMPPTPNQEREALDALREGLHELDLFAGAGEIGKAYERDPDELVECSAPAATWIKLQRAAQLLGVGP